MDADPTQVPAPAAGAHDAGPEGLSVATTLRVAVTSDQRLLADMAAAALAGVGVHTTTIDWPSVASSGAVRRRLLGFRPHVCLSLYDLEDPASARIGDLLLDDETFPWVVLATGEPGPAWGSALHAGAHAVVPGRLTMAELVTALRHAAAREEVMDPGERASVVQAWTRTTERDQRLIACLDALTPREMFVLRHLYEGERVSTIASDAGVSEATVRSQVKSVLRKLGVGSQIAAVAAYRQVRHLVPAGMEDPTADD